MPALHEYIEAHWQQPRWYWTLFLWPLARVFQVTAAIRRGCYARGWCKAQRLPRPVVVVGNIHAGGVGKTPIVAALVRSLQQCGVKVGVISRGYGRQSNDTVLLQPDSSADEVGDEPLMLYRQTGVPVAVGKNRVAAGQCLLAAHPETAVMISDDGLQHYALARDVEVAVFPTTDVGRHLDLLPNGPLREPLSRLRKVNAVIISQGSAAQQQILAAQLRLPETICLGHSENCHGLFYRAGHPQQTATPADFTGKSVVAVAGIARPQRFFTALHNMGITLTQTIALPDHGQINVAALPRADCIIITEKDAVKLNGECHDSELWVLPLTAQLTPDLGNDLCRYLRLSKTAAP